MEQSALAEIGLPVVVFLVMVVVGMALDLDRFRELLASPRALLVGISAQLVAMPLLGFAVAFLFRGDPVVAIGLVLLASAPGGATSNLIVHTVEGNRALSVSLTALSGSVTWFSIPLLLNVAVRWFGDDTTVAGVAVLETMGQVAALTVLPVMLGMTIRHRDVDFAERTRRVGRHLASVALTVIIVALLIENLELVRTESGRLFPALLVLNAAATAVGYGLARLASLNRTDAVTIGVETGIQNATVAIAVALVALNSSPLSVVPGLYGLWMLGAGWLFASTMLRSSPLSV